MIILNKKNIIWLFTVYNHFLLIIANKINVKEFENDMLKAVAEIIKSCQIYDQSSILIAGTFNHNDIQLLSDIKPKIMRSSLELLKQPTENTIESLIISTTSVDHLTKFFMQIIHSSIWNRLKYSIILNKSTMNNNCDEYFSYLHVSLKYDMINTIFLCITPSKKIILYTSNPYTSWAPAPWKMDKQQQNHTQSGYIYTTQYNPNTIACGDLFFDKTQRFNQYGIAAVTYVPVVFSKWGVFYNYQKSPKKVFDQKISNLLFDQLNISMSLFISNEYGTFDELGNPCGVDKDVVENKFDILVDSRFLDYTNDSLQSSSILGETGVTFVSHYRANVSTIMRIINYFRPIIMFFSIIVLGITIAILKISLNENFSVAVMEVFRLFFNGPLLRVPNRQSPRIFIFTIFIFILVMQTILRSKILSFIMVPESNNLDTFTDLANHKDYTIYCLKGFNTFLPPEIEERCHISTFYMPSSVQEPKGVFVWEQYSNIGMAYQYNMHPSKEVLAKHHITFRMRRNWPLAKRVNEMFIRFFESGISSNNLERAHHYIKILNYYLIENVINDSRTLNLQDLDFAFQILVFGLILACIMFFIEIKCWEYIHQYFNRALTYCCTNKCKKNYT